MEVKPGYKKTEVGVIPEEWDVKRLGDLGTVVRGGSPRPAGDPRYFNGNFIPWLTVAALTNVSEHHLTISETVSCLTEEGSKHSRTLVDGTLVLANSGATLGVAKLLGVTCCANDGIAAIINQQMGEKAFICSYINTQTKHLREVIATGNGQPNLNTDLIREITIPFPPLAEQHAIAEVLGDVDALLGSLEKLIAKKRDLKQAAMQQLLTGKKRLPGFSGEWEVKKLGDRLLARPDYGINAPAVPFSDRLPSYLRITDISEHGCFCPAPRVSVKAASADQFYLQEGEVVFARTGASVGKSYSYNSRDGRLVFAGFLIRVRPNPKALVSAFLAAYATTQAYWNWVRLMSMRSGQPGINGNEYAQLSLPLPPVSEQTAIAEVLSDMDAELAALEQRLAKTRDLKQGMMQELLTGRTRLV